MTTLFSKPDFPKPPTPDNSAQKLADAAQRERLARGRASTMINGVAGVEGEPITSSSMLLAG